MTVWELTSESTENKWALGQVNISGQNIVIEAEKDTEHAGYAAVDEFLIIPNLDKCDTLPPHADVNKPTQPPTSPPDALPDCDFEIDTCGWNVEAELNGTEFFIFIRTFGELHEGGDGPKTDHTESKSAYFLWANAKLGNPGTVTSLSSKPVKKSEKVCFNFWFDMTHNSGISDLQVYVESVRDLTRILIWEFHSTKFDFWEEGRVEIEKFEEYKVLITAVRGDINAGYVALDDFSFQANEEFCSTKPEDATITTTAVTTSTTTSKPNHPGPKCDFEDDTCGWELFGMEFKFERTDSQTLADGGHDAPTTNHKGKFMYTEAKLGVDGETASMRSPEEPSGLNSCMLFYYSMYHHGGIKSLKIKTINSDMKEEYIWDLTDSSQESNSQWLIGQVNVVNAQQIVVEVTKGADTQGYVAIDSLYFDDSPLLPNCDILPPDAAVTPPTPTPPVIQDCDFEQDFCTWYTKAGPESGEQFVWHRTTGSEQNNVQGPEENHDGKKDTWFVWTSAESGKNGTSTQLVSPISTTQTNTCFKFWFKLLPNTGITQLQVLLEHDNNMQNLIWEYTSKLTFWEKGQVLIEKGLNFKIILAAFHGEVTDGYAAVDDFEFLFDSVECPSLPDEPPVTTATPSPEDCPGKLKCADGNGCYAMDQRCDFFSDCLDNTDEQQCPSEYVFDNCEEDLESENCGWEEMPHDNLDWIIATKADTESTSHPVDRAGKFLWIQKKEGSIAEATARIHSPEYQNSKSDCKVLFWYFVAGDMGSAYLKPVVHIVEEATDIVLDHFGENNKWDEIEIQIGRRKGKFEVAFEKDIDSVFDASVAIDDLEFVGCEMPRPDSGECGEAKPFHCNNKACIETEFVCDLTDDCGDASDELVTYCHDNHYTMVSFEDDESPLGIFSIEGSVQSLHWQRWSGETSNLHTGPAMDHTTFTTTGHYVFVNSSLMSSDPSEKAKLVSRAFEQSSSDGPECELTLNYFMYGAGVGTLEVVVRPSEGEEAVIFSLPGSEANRNGWERKRIKVEKSTSYTEYVIAIEASVEMVNLGDMAVDDITFSPTCRLKAGDNPTTPTPAPCKDQFTCGDGTCIPLTSLCNFHKDCPNDSKDEDTCPDTFSFEDCTSELCGWTSSNPDIFDWTVTSLQDLAVEDNPNRPHLDYENKTEAHFLYVGTLMAGSEAGVNSPIYQDSSTYCNFTFYVYMSGSPNFYIYPTLTHFELSAMSLLDKIDLAGFEDGVWSQVAIGIGRHRDKFDLGFQIVYPGEDMFDSSVAVDEVQLLSCSLPPAEEDCQENEFHCAQSKACVHHDFLCDFADDCGDGSDEELAFQDCMSYTRMNFEDPINPWGFFNESEEALNGFNWSRGNGSLQQGTGPSFDHTTFGPIGHYLYIASNLHDKNEIAQITTPLIHPVSAGCYLRFYYHMHGRGVGNLTVYLKKEGSQELNEIWINHGNAAGGVDLNEWLRAQIDLTMEAESRLVFEASVGEKELGNIAIDDVTFTTACVFDYNPATTTPPETTHTTHTTRSTTKSTTPSTTTKTTTKRTSTTKRTTPPTTGEQRTTENATPSPSNPNSHMTAVVGVIVGVLVAIVLIVAVVVTIKMRFVRVPSLSQVQSYLNPNYRRFDDNNMVSLRDLTSKTS